MTDRNLKNLVTEAVTLDREINEKSERLKAIKAKLVEAGRSTLLPHCRRPLGRVRQDQFAQISPVSFRP